MISATELSRNSIQVSEMLDEAHRLGLSLPVNGLLLKSLINELSTEADGVGSDLEVAPKLATVTNFKNWAEIKNQIEVPEYAEDYPRVTIFLSPVRSGSTALFLAACGSNREEGFDEVYFQPFKGLLRGKGSQLKFAGGPERHIFIKSTIGVEADELYDPVAMLLDLGFPPGRIKVIYGLREPVGTFLSIRRHKEDYSPQEFQVLYSFMLNLFVSHIFSLSDSAISHKPIPLAYELLEQLHASAVLQRLFGSNFATTFIDEEQLLADTRIHLGEANPNLFPEYYQQFIKTVLDVGQYRFTSQTNRDQMLTKHPQLTTEVEEVEELTNPLYKLFLSFVNQYWAPNPK
jgi:hypothetical protein